MGSRVVIFFDPWNKELWIHQAQVLIKIRMTSSPTPSSLRSVLSRRQYHFSGDATWRQYKTTEYSHPSGYAHLGNSDILGFKVMFRIGIVVAFGIRDRIVETRGLILCRTSGRPGTLGACQGATQIVHSAGFTFMIIISEHLSSCIGMT